MEILFISFLILSIYSYLLFPPILWGLKGVLPRKWKQRSNALPVSIIVSVYNEESVIKKKIEISLALNYPDDLLEIIISSDGSNDRTNSIVAQFNDPRVVLKTFERLGKTECLNRVVPQARGEIILFTSRIPYRHVFEYKNSVSRPLCRRWER